LELAEGYNQILKNDDGSVFIYSPFSKVSRSLT
jgi:hypothetical protein